MVIKIILVLMLLFMAFNLSKAMFIMLRNDPNGPSMSKYIGRRLLFSVAIIGLIIVALLMGWITPNPSPY